MSGLIQEMVYTIYVRSGYRDAKESETSNNQLIPPLYPPPDISKAIWSADTTPKIKHFLWRLLSKALAVKENLSFRHISVDVTCRRCCQHVESTDHLFFQCYYAQRIWRRIGISTSVLCNTTTTVEDKL